MLKKKICQFMCCISLLLALQIVDRAVAQTDGRTKFFVLVPYFSGEAAIAKPVANFIRLQLSATFQEAATNTRGQMVWGEYQLSPSTHETAVRRALSADAAAHMVLWGDTFQMADGVAVQSFLSMTPRLERRAKRPEVWSLRVGNAGNDARFLSLGLPRKFYQFSPILIPDEAARSYQNLEGIPIYESRNLIKKIGTIGKIFRAYKYETKAAYVSSNGRKGWISLPFLSDEQNVAVDFAGAVMRLCRGDFAGARQLLLRVKSATKIVDKGLLTNTLLLLGLTNELENRSGAAFFEDAIKLSPFDRMAAAYWLLGLAADVERTKARPRRAAAVEKLKREMDASARLFSPNSNWFALLVKFADEVEPRKK